MSEVRLASGRRIDWNNPPQSNQICSLKLGDETYKGSLRTLAHMNRANNLSKKKFGEPITIFQGPFHKGVPASAGTHDFDCTWDGWIDGVPAWDQQRFFRSIGFADWYRHGPLFLNHQHMFTLPPHRGASVNDDFRQAGLKVGKYIDGGVSLGLSGLSSQIQDYYNHAFALVGQHERGSDDSWFPKKIEDTVFNLRAYIEKRAA